MGESPFREGGWGSGLSTTAEPRCSCEIPQNHTGKLRSLLVEIKSKSKLTGRSLKCHSFGVADGVTVALAVSLFTPSSLTSDEAFEAGDGNAGYDRDQVSDQGHTLDAVAPATRKVIEILHRRVPFDIGQLRTTLPASLQMTLGQGLREVRDDVLDGTGAVDWGHHFSKLV